jgi:Zn-dependent peptidase ImmA (M78 family)
MAAQIRNYLAVPVDVQMGWPSVDEALEQWREIFASVGIFVFKDAFHVEGYFGFCLYDAEFPIIYVNNSSAKSRQIFTLFHELGHLLFHTSGIDVLDESYIDHLAADNREIEIICNGFAAEFLVPELEFERQLVGRSPDRATASLIADRLNVSREVIYRKMLDRRLISRTEYMQAADLWRQQAKQSGAGGNYYNTHLAYLGPRYVDLAFKKYYERRFDVTQLAEYLNIKPRNLPALEAIYGRR